MIDRDPIDLLVHRCELTAKVVETEEDEIRVVVENYDGSQMGRFLDHVTNGYFVDVSHDDRAIQLLVRAVKDETYVDGLRE